MLLRLFSGLFALAFGLLFAQVPGFFSEKQAQLVDQLDQLTGEVSSSEEMASSAGMDLAQFVRSLESHPDPNLQLRAQQIVETQQAKGNTKDSLTAFEAAPPWNKLPILFLHHQALRSLPLERQQLFELPDSKESYTYGFTGFLIGIFFFSILLFLGMSFKKFYKLRRARKLLASRGYGY
jgi:hypothetical protein